MARQGAKLQKEKPDASLHQSKDSSNVLAPFQQEYEKLQFQSQHPNIQS
jgi:hypothetical protein